MTDLAPVPGEAFADLDLSDLDLAALVPVVAEEDFEHHCLSVRHGAAKTLRQLGPMAAPFAQHLAAKMDHHDPAMHRRAAAALEWMGEEGAYALASQLGNADYLVRRTAMEALSQMGAEGAAALSGAAASGSRESWASASEALCWMGELGAKTLASHLEDASADVRLLAVEALGRCSEAAAAGHLARMAWRLEDPEPALHAAAARTLRGHAAPGASALAEGPFASGGAGARARAEAALQEMGPLGAAALADLLGSSEAGVRRRAGVALQGLGCDAGGALAHKLLDRDAGIRWRAAEALGNLRPDSCSAAHSDALAVCLEDESSWVRTAALRSLEKLGVGATEAHAAALKGRLADGNHLVRSCASRVLQQPGDLAAGGCGGRGPRRISVESCSLRPNGATICARHCG